MDSGTNDALQPELNRATEQLAEALDEACAVDVERADTGELIRVEEVLAIANEAAKTAVSIRRSRSLRNEPAAADEQSTTSLLSVRPPAGHRTFVDAAGAQWDAFAVYPSRNVAGRSRLPDPYRHGWLAFETRDEKRRLSPIPERWDSLRDDELASLCSQAERVRRGQSSARD